MALSNEQQNNFDSYNKRLGFSKGELSDFSSATKSPAIVLSADPAKSSVPPKMIKVNDINELKALIDMPHIEIDNHINLTSIPNVSDVKQRVDLTRDERHAIKLAATQYIVSNPTKLASVNVNAINNAMFPLTLAAFSAENITVTKENPLKLTDGTINNFGTVTVEEGGQIESDGTATLVCQNLIQKGQVSAGTYTIRVELPAITPPKADNGENGNPTSEKGEKGSNGTSCGKHCKSKPGNGGQGPGGESGGNGHNGLHGAHGPILTCNINNAEGNIAIYVGAQAGQAGGNGGNGGDGGDGGDPGDCPSACSGSCASKGLQGNGGDGGDGGDGGNGGNGSQVYFTYGGSGSITPTLGESLGGKHGTKGTGGKGNDKGDDGIDGTDGTAGTKPIIVS